MPITFNTNIPEKKVIPLIKESIEREIRYLSIGIKKTKKRIRYFQNRFGENTSSEVTDIPPLDLVEWEGEEITLQKLEEKLEILKNVTIL